MLLTLLLLVSTSGDPMSDGAERLPPYRATVEPLKGALREEMNGVSWRPGCPVALDELRRVEVLHLTYDGGVASGELIVHQDIADDIAAIFGELYAAGFRIERMERVDRYGGDDDASMAANNTSAFNCRPVAGAQRTWSLHAFGLAVDVNPKTNPFVRKGRVDPPGGEAYLDRTKKVPGLIQAGDAVVQAFTSRGFAWGGAWRSLKDYQHFERKSDKPRKIPSGRQVKEPRKPGP